MRKYKGPTKHLRLPAEDGSLDEYKWVTFKDGDVVPKNLEKDVYGDVESEVQEEKVTAAKPELPKKKVPKKKKGAYIGRLSRL